MPERSPRDSGTGRAGEAVASYERELGFWREREDMLLAELEEVREFERDDDRRRWRCERIEAGLASARSERRRVAAEVECFRRMAERGWQPPDPRGPEAKGHARALLRANRREARATPPRRDRLIGARRSEGRPRGSRRSASRGSPRAGPDDDGDSDPDGEHHPLVVRETAGAAT